MKLDVVQRLLSAADMFLTKEWLVSDTGDSKSLPGMPDRTRWARSHQCIPVETELWGKPDSTEGHTSNFHQVLTLQMHQQMSAVHTSESEGECSKPRETVGPGKRQSLHVSHQIWFRSVKLLRPQMVLCASHQRQSAFHLLPAHSSSGGK